MNILFIQKTMGLGGVNVVTATLATKFQQEGNQVDVFAFQEGKNDILRERYGKVPIHIGHGFRVCKDNVCQLHQLILERNIELVVNQWGLSYIPTATLKKACHGTKTKWISYYHSNPLFNGRVQSIHMQMDKTTNALRRLFLRGKHIAIRKVTSMMMRHNYHACWRFIVLSNSYIRNFQEFTGLKNTDKLRALSNPVTINTDGFSVNIPQKKKEIIFVGRLDPEVKRVSRIVSAWSMIEASCPDWHLRIIGEGPERPMLERIISDLHLERISLEGVQQPRPYYERASILVMTSDFEGFPLVLAEAMTFGVVPVVYDSFDALYDIIDDGENGVIVPKVNGGFSIKMMAEKLQGLMFDENMRKEMIQKALEKSKDFNMNGIYHQWMNIFNEMKEENMYRQEELFKKQKALSIFHRDTK